VKIIALVGASIANRQGTSRAQACDAGACAVGRKGFARGHGWGDILEIGPTTLKAGFCAAVIFIREEYPEAVVAQFRRFFGKMT
jgi:hypothetical protein